MELEIQSGITVEGSEPPYHWAGFNMTMCDHYSFMLVFVSILYLYASNV